MSESPSAPDSGATSPSPAPQYGTPEGSTSAAAPPAIPPKKKGWIKYVAGGCGCITLIAVLIGGCTVISAISSQDDRPSTTTSAPAPETTTEAPAPAAPAPTTDDGPASAAPPADQPAEEAPAGDVPADYTSALKQAESYSETLHMSKQGIYDQLTSEYGGKFSDEAAQYAVDNVKVDWNANALQKAKDYQKTMNMSPDAIHDQLTSVFEGFTEEEADYAIAHLND